jgi:hypothetical protein
MIEIRNKSGKVIHTVDGDSLREADLEGMDLTEANLSRANLTEANLRGANLTGANLTGADLVEANLSWADLRGADLRWANLTEANLTWMNLTEADLRGADLRWSNFSAADLRGADLRWANLEGVDLFGANLTDAILPGFQIPQGVDLVVYKKGQRNSIITLRIPAAARRTASLVGNKCRAEYAEVLEIQDAEGNSIRSVGGWRGFNFIYTVGETVRPDSYDSDIRIECTQGIHFFMTREEAVALVS